MLKHERWGQALIYTCLILGILARTTNGNICSGGQDKAGAVDNLTFNFNLMNTIYMTYVASCINSDCRYEMGRFYDPLNLSDYYAVLRKMNANDTVNWQVAYLAIPADFSVTMDEHQTSAYFVDKTPTTTLRVVKVDANSGAIARVIEISSYRCPLSTCPLVTDSSVSTNPALHDVYIFGFEPSGRCSICVFNEASPTVTTCYTIGVIRTPTGALLLRSGELFLVSRNVLPMSNLKLLKINLSASVWNLRYECGTNCLVLAAKTQLHQENTTLVIYSMICLPTSGIILALDEATGLLISTTHRLKFDHAGDCNTNKMAIRNEKIYVLFFSSTGSYFMITDLSLSNPNQYKYYQFDSTLSMQYFDFETHTNSLGQKSTNLMFVRQLTDMSYGYLTRVNEYLLYSHPMCTVLSSPLLTQITDTAHDMILDPNLLVTFDGAAIPVSNLALTSTPLSVSLGSSNSRDTIFETRDIYITVPGGIVKQESVTMSCAKVPGITFTATLEQYGSKILPTWITFDVPNSKVNLIVPSFTEDQQFIFSLKEVSSEGGTEFSRQVYLTVTYCSIDNCETCGDTSDLCATCEDGYVLYHKNSNCEKDEVSTESKILSSLTLTVLGTNISLSTIASLLTFSSPTSVWLMINLFQNIMLLLLTSAYFPKKVVDYFAGMKVTIFSFGFLSVNNIPGIRSVVEWIDVEVDDYYYQTICVDSTSTLVNNTSLLFTLFVILLLHLLFLLINMVSKKYKSASGCWKKTLLISFGLFTFKVYIRVILEAFMFILISSVFELDSWNTQDTSSITSLIISLIVYFMCIGCVLGVATINVLTLKSIGVRFLVYTKELFSGLRTQKTAQCYTLINLGKNVLLVSFLIFSGDLSVYAKVGMIVGIQILQTVYKIVVRPLDGVKENVLDIMNEILFLLLSTWLFYFNTKSSWTSGSPSVYIGLILGFNVAAAIVSTVFLVKLLLKKYKECRKSINKVTSKTTVEKYVTPAENAEISSNLHSVSKIYESQNKSDNSFVQFAKSMAF